MEVKEPDMAYGGLYTYADYLTWDLKERVELLKGKIFKMSPAPNMMHQKISIRISSKIFNFLVDNKCEIFSAPFDVRFPGKSKKDEDITTVLQPDICVICEQSKLDDRGCNGAPDIVIEILSPVNNKKELKNKYEIYESSGVKEYWVVSPQDKTFLAYTLDSDGKYIPGRLLVEGHIYESIVLKGFVLNLEEIFKD